jgi:uncharacterized membrane-anchored protein YhcB (DUF1043 family)
MEHIQTFASLEPTELAPILGIFVGMLAGFYALVKYLLNAQEKINTQHSITQELDREERKELTKSFNRVAEATERSAREAEQRNGHLAEISMTNKDQIITAIHGLVIDKQTVHHQTVEHERVINKEETKDGRQ